jgi:hypothetical protein
VERLAISAVYSSRRKAASMMGLYVQRRFGLG